MKEHVTDRLSAYRDGELSVVEAGDVRQHLAGCEVCSMELRTLEAVDRAVRELPANAPPGYFDTFASRVRGRIEAAPTARTSHGLPRWSWALAAALLLGVIVPRMPWDRWGRSPEAPAAAPLKAPLPTPAAAPEDAQAPRFRAREDHALEADSFRQGPPGAPTAAPAVPAPGTPPTLAPPAAPVPAPQAVRPGQPARVEEGAYAEPPPATAVPSTADARVAAAAEAEAAPAPVGLLEEAAAGKAAAPAAAPAKEEAEAKRPLEKKQQPKLRAQSGEAAPGRSGLRGKDESSAPPAEGALRDLESREARSLEALRAQREDWRRFAETRPDDPRADEARVQVVALGAEIARGTDRAEDLARVRADAAAYLARADARQKERVRALLAPFDRR